MGTTLSSGSHFVANELLHLWRQATVIMAGCNIIFISFRSLSIIYCNPSRSDSAV